MNMSIYKLGGLTGLVERRLGFLCCVLPFFVIVVGVMASMIVVSGDSITAGNEMPKEEQRDNWVRLVEQGSNGQFKVVNEGKGGRQTMSLKEFDGMLKSVPKADVLVIALGTNDSRDVSNGCVPEAVANLQAMIDKAHATYGANLRVLLVGPPNIFKTALSSSKSIGDQRVTKLRALGEAFAHLAKERNCDVVSLDGIVPESSLMKAASILTVLAILPSHASCFQNLTTK